LIPIQCSRLASEYGFTPSIGILDCMLARGFDATARGCKSMNGRTLEGIGKSKILDHKICKRTVLEVSPEFDARRLPFVPIPQVDSK
jgi:hypothetical protein